MFEDTVIVMHAHNRERLRQLRTHFEQKEREEFRQHARERTDEEKELLSEYMQLHLTYGERRPPRESGLVVFYRKLLRLPEETSK